MIVGWLSVIDKTFQRRRTMFKSSSNLWKGLVVLIMLSIVLAACAPAATPTPAPKPTEAPAQPTAAMQPTDAPTAAPKPTEAATATAATKPTEAPQPTELPTAAPFVSTSSGKTAPSSGIDCPAPANKIDVTSKELNLFVWTDYIPTDEIECFEAVYGIKVNRKEYSKNEEMLAVMTAGNTNYDLVQPTDYAVTEMLRQGLLQKLDHSRLPALQYFDPNYLNLSFDKGNEYTIPYEAGTDSIVYNADKIKNPPTSYADLWNPDFINAKRMISLDDERAVIGATLLTLGYDVNTQDPQQLNEAKTKLAELAKGIKLYDSDSPKDALIAGDVDLGIVWTGDVELAHRANPAITFVYPKEGPIIWQDNYAIPKDAPHLDAAYAWLNYTMQPDLFWTMLRDWPYTNPNKAMLDFVKDNPTQVKDINGDQTTLGALYQLYVDSPITNTPQEIVKAGHRIDYVDQARPLYDRIWTEIKK
jgi:spermidine/putrescine-binding protein